MAPEALMTTDGFLPWSAVFGAPLGTALTACEPPCAIWDDVTPFTGEAVADFAFWEGAETPAGAGGVCVVAVIALA